MEKKKGGFSSSIGFVLSAAGSAVARRLQEQHCHDHRGRKADLSLIIAVISAPMTAV